MALWQRRHGGSCCLTGTSFPTGSTRLGPQPERPTAPVPIFPRRMASGRPPCPSVRSRGCVRAAFGMVTYGADPDGDEREVNRFLFELGVMPQRADAVTRHEHMEQACHTIRTEGRRIVNLQSSDPARLTMSGWCLAAKAANAKLKSSEFRMPSYECRTKRSSKCLKFGIWNLGDTSPFAHFVQ